MTRTPPTRRARAAGSAAAACALLASLAVRAQTSPPAEPPPATTPSPPPAAAPPPAATLPPPATGAPATPPAAAPSPPPAAPAPSPPAAAAPSPPPALGTPSPPPPPSPRPQAPYPPYPYAYPPQGYPYPYAPTYPYPPPGYAYPPPGYAPAAYPPPAGQQQPPAPPPAGAPPPPVEALATPGAPPLGSARTPAEDAQADRGVLLPTAYTHPKGTTYISTYDLIFNQIGYAFTDDTQLTLTGIPPVGEERIAIFDLTLKTSLYRGGRVRLAGLGSASGIAAKEIGIVGVGRVGGVVQLCVESKCDSSLSLSSNVTLAGFMLMTNGVSGIFRLGRTLSLLAELDTAVPLVRDSSEFGGAMTGGGVRFHWTSFGLDLALMHVIGNAKATLPIVAFTWRSGS